MALPSIDTSHPRGVLVRNLSVLAGSQAITWSASLVWALVVPRSLGASGTGIFTLSVAASQFIGAVISLGMKPLLVREIASQRDRAPRLLASAILVRLVLAVPMLGAVALFARQGHFEGPQLAAIYFGWGIAVVYTLYEPILAALQAIERMQYLAYTDVLTKTVVILVSVGLVLIGFGVIALLTTTITVMTVVLALNFVWLRRYFRIQWRVAPHDLWALVVDSLPYCGFALFFTFYLWIDSLMLGLMTPARVVGWYGMPTKLFGSLMFLPVILSTAWLPRLTAAHRSGGDAHLARSARPPIEIVVALSLPICVGVYLLAGPVIHFLYGPEFDRSAPIMSLLALSVPPMYLNIMVNQVLIAGNRQMVWTKAMGVACVVNPALNLLLIPYFQRTQGNGALGAALSLLVTEICLAAIAVLSVRDCFAGSFGSRMFRAALATAAMAAALVLGGHLGLGLEVPLAVGVYALMAWRLRVITVDELGQLQDMARLIRRRTRPVVEAV